MFRDERGDEFEHESFIGEDFESLGWGVEVGVMCEASECIFVLNNTINILSK